MMNFSLLQVERLDIMIVNPIQQNNLKNSIDFLSSICFKQYR